MWEKAKIYGLCALAVILLAAGVYFYFYLTGDGKLECMFTLGGICVVDKPGGQNVVCFIQKDSLAMSCIPKSQL